MYLKKTNLKNKTALVTGAGKGIGRACAIALAEAGANLIILSRTKNDLDGVAKTIKKYKSRCVSYVCDVTNYNQIKNIISKQNKIDILINNAGITKDKVLLRMSSDDWDSVINTNLKGCYNGIKASSRSMIKNKYGRIINIVSVIGQIGNAGQSNYAASKAGIIGLTKSMAKEMGSRNITINCVSPGFIVSDMTTNIAEKMKLFLLVLTLKKHHKAQHQLL